MLHFQNPQWLFAIIPTTILLAGLLIKSYFTDKRILKYFGAAASRFKVVALFLIFVVIFSSLFAIFAKPQGKTLKEITTLSVRGDYVLLVDTSLSTRASQTPLTKSELEIAKDIIRDLLRNIPARFQLVGYARAAIDFSSLTENIDYLETILEKNFYSGIVPLPGSDMAEAIYTVINYKREDPEKYKNLEYIILFSDGDVRMYGVSGEEIVIRLSAAISEAKAHGLKIISVGVGSATGWKIPVYNEDGEFTGKYLREGSFGPEFVSYLNERNLRIIAELTGGRYFYYNQIDELRPYIMSTLLENYILDDVRESVNVKDMYYVYAWIAMGCLSVLLLFRKKLL